MTGTEHRLPWEQVALAVSVFAAAAVGGFVALDPAPLASRDVVTAVLGGPELPRLTHALIALPTLLALAWVGSARRVVNLPSNWVLLPLGMFFVWFASTALTSRFPWYAASTWLEWCAYAAGLALVVAVGGKRRGLVLIASAMFAGAVLPALRGVLEFAMMRHADPSWRIFGGWVSPNALAGTLLVGLGLSLGLAVLSRGTTRLLVVVTGGIVLCALLLTQSKAGILAGLVGLATYGVACLAYGERKTLLAPLGVLACGALLTLAVVATTPRDAAANAPLTRIGRSAETQEQSVGFRRLLWRSAWQLAHTGTGVGPGSFRFESGRPGLVEQTVLAHSSLLQIAAEASFVGAGLFLALLLGWARCCMFAGRRVADGLGPLRCGVFAALAATLAHGVAESNLYIFGTGFAFFVLLGLGLQLAPDGSNPEQSPAAMRRTGSVLLLGVAVLLTGNGVLEFVKSRLMGDVIAGSTADVPERAAALVRAAPWDPEVWTLAANYAPESALPGGRIGALRRSAELAPSTRNLRAVARALVAKDDTVGAVVWLRRALRIDPTSLRTHKLLVETLLGAGLQAEARTAAEELIAIEDSPSFRIRALPQIVPTETYFAREVVAMASPDPQTRIDFLRPAYDGYLRYARTTLPQVRRMASVDPTGAIGGETWESACERMAEAASVAARLARAYRELGLELEAAEVEDGAAEFEVGPRPSR